MDSDADSDGCGWIRMRMDSYVGNWFTSGVNVDSGSLDHHWGDVNYVNWNHEWGDVDNEDWITSGGDADNGNWFTSGVTVDRGSLDRYWGDQMWIMGIGITSGVMWMESRVG